MPFLSTMDDNTHILATSAAFVLVAVVAHRLFSSSRRYPPGPKGLPLVGNITDMPVSQQWLEFAKMGREYGGITYLNILGMPIIILNDPKFAQEILERNAKISSDRVVLTMGGKLLGLDESAPLIQYGDTWIQQRRLFTQFMGSPAKVQSFGHVFQHETNIYLKNILNAPSEWVQHTYHLSGSISLNLTYGYSTKGKDDPLIKIVNTGMEHFSETTVPNAFMVDVFPILRFVPSWFPGAAWKKKAIRYHAACQAMVDTPYHWAKEQLKAGTFSQSFLSERFSDKQVGSREEHIIKWASTAIYTGAADTTVAGIKSFFLALTRHRAEQQIAQAEMDSVLEAGYLPTLADRSRLPYFEAFFTEFLRLYPFTPLALPHVTTQEDVYGGYFIPKGSVVIPNSWQFLRDPKTYSDPEVFRPERFTDSSKVKDPRDYVFGYGRRRCPGIHFADASMWLACASIVAAFDVHPPLKNGKQTIPPAKFLDGAISHPAPFECIITPRPGAAESIRTL
ncbi:cytochrome P450 [Mycena floridula]|nr:cytochrome P450 [Mycena floridula]